MQAYIGLGSNLGERETMIRLALDDIARLPGVALPYEQADQPQACRQRGHSTHKCHL